MSKEYRIRDILRNILSDMENEKYDFHKVIGEIKRDIRIRFDDTQGQLLGITRPILLSLISSELDYYMINNNIKPSNEKQIIDIPDHLIDSAYIDSRINKLKTYEAQIKSLNDKTTEYNKRCENYEEQIKSLNDTITCLTNENDALRKNLMKLLITIDEFPNLQ